MAEVKDIAGHLIYNNGPVSRRQQDFFLKNAKYENTTTYP
jgi:hypothetical protein